MNPTLLALLLLISVNVTAQEKSKLPKTERLTPNQIEKILDFESDDEKKEEDIRRRLRKLNPRKDEAEKRVMIASAIGVVPVDLRQRGES